MENNNITFSFARVVDGEKIAYSVVMLVGDQFQLLPFGTDSMESLKGMINFISESFNKTKLMMDVYLSPDGETLERIDTTENPMYLKKEE